MTPNNHGAKWTLEQDEWLIMAMKTYTIQECADKMERTFYSIRSRILKLIYDLYKKGSIDLENKVFNIPMEEIKEYIHLQELPNRGAEWDSSQDEWLKLYVKKKGIEYCAEKMGRSNTEVQKRIQYLIIDEIDNGKLNTDIYQTYGFNEEHIQRMIEYRTNFIKLTDVTHLDEENGPYYVVLRGNTPGIFNNWDLCSASIYRYGNAKFKKCKTKQEAIDYINEFHQTQPAKTSKKTNEINVQSIEKSVDDKNTILDKTQQKIVDEVFQSKRNIVILGSAGTGKSTIIRELIKVSNKYNKKIGITATTGCAAILIGGNTLHSFMGIGTAEDKPLYLANRIMSRKNILIKLIQLEILLIDEISMMNDELLSKVSDVLSIIRDNSMPFGGIQVILVGDFYQLPPVSGNLCFKADIWTKMNFSIHRLTKIYRQQDPHFLEILDRAKQGTITDEDIAILKKCDGKSFPKNIIPTRLYSLNVDVSLINDKYYNKLTTVEKAYQTKYKNIKSQKYATKMKIPELLKLRVGSQVMVTKNIDPDNNIINGTRGVVISMAETSVKIQLMNQIEYVIKEIKITSIDEPNIEIEYIPLKLAWAITIHKSQGLTLDCAEIDLGESIFQSGQAYTALSRVKDLNSVHIVDVNKNSFRTHPEVNEFYKKTYKNP